MIGSSSIGHSMPKSPRATMITSALSIILSIERTANWSSIFATICALLFFLDRSWRSCSMSLFSRTKLSATKSTPSSVPSATSAMSFFQYDQLDQAVIDQNLIADCDILHESGVIHIHGILFFAFCATRSELQNI